MGQRNAGVGRAAAGRGDARHHLEGNAVGRQFVDFLAATAKYERIAALQAQHALALLGQLDQLAVDLVLGHGVVGAALADVQAVGVAAAQFEDGRGHQAVVEHHVGLLHQAQGAEGQQVRVARAGADQVDLAAGLGLAVFQLVGQQALGFRRLPGEHAFGHRALEHFLPELAALLQVRQALLDRFAEAAGQPGQLAVGGGNPGFQPGPQQARQHRRVAAAGDRQQQRRAVDDGGEDHAAQRRRVHHVDRHAAGVGIAGHLGVQRLVVGGGDGQHAVAEIGLGVAALQQFATALLHQFAQFAVDLRRDHAQHGAGTVEQARLAQGDFTAADQECATPAQDVEQRQRIHLSRSPRCRPCRA